MFSNCKADKKQFLVRRVPLDFLLLNIIKIEVYMIKLRGDERRCIKL